MKNRLDNYLQDLYDAFISIDSKYYFTEVLKDPHIILDGEKDKESLIQLTERHFAAELYSEWKQKIKQSKTDYSNLMIGFEVSKKFIKNKLVKDKEVFIPDLVLHQSQMDFHPDFQKIYIEIKTTPSLNLKKICPDIKKTLFAMTQYRFKYGVFICVNCDYNRLLKLLSNVIEKLEKIDNGFSNEWKNLYLFYANNKGEKHYKAFNECKNVQHTTHAKFQLG